MEKIKEMSIDLETYSDVDIKKSGVYKYAESENFEILLFAVSINGDDVIVYDLACGDVLPDEILDAIVSDDVIKWAFNASFERISKKVKTGIKTKGMSGKPIVTEAPYGYVKDPDNKDFWIIDEEAAEVVRLIFRLFLDGKNRNQIAVYLTQEQIPTPTFYMKDRGRGTCKNKTLNEDNRYKWNKATLTHILTRQEYCGDVVNFKTTKHFRDKRNHYVDRSQWHITENVHEPIIDRTDFENVQRILENAPVKRPNGDGEIHPLSGLLFCKDCGAKMHIRIDYRNGGKRHVAYCSEYHKGKAKNPKCSSPHIMDADLLMQTVADVLKKIAEYSISNRAEFEALVKKSLAMQQTDKVKKQQKRIPQITTRLEQIDKVLNKLYEDNALGTIPQDR